MQTILALHNILRWAVLLFGLLTVVKALSGLASGRLYTAADNRSNLFFMISCDVQLLLGLALLFKNGWFEMLQSGMGDAMKNPLVRFFTMEHGLMMIIAWILVHIGRSSVKRTLSDRSKHRKSLIYFGLALVIILASIPWPFREIARPYFPAF